MVSGKVFSTLSLVAIISLFSASPAEATYPKPQTNGKPLVHIVKQGDNLFRLYRQYSVKVHEILKANPGIDNKDIINVGQEIKIPGRVVYTIQPGDSV